MPEIRDWEIRGQVDLRINEWVGMAATVDRTDTWRSLATVLAYLLRADAVWWSGIDRMVMGRVGTMVFGVVVCERRDEANRVSALTFEVHS
jgi:hypothetical protein